MYTKGTPRNGGFSFILGACPDSNWNLKMQ